MKQRIKRISIVFVILVLLFAAYCAALRAYYMYDVFFENILWNEEASEPHYSSDNRYRMTVYYDRNSTSTVLYHKFDKKGILCWIPDAVYATPNGFLTEDDVIASVLDSYEIIENHRLYKHMEKLDNNELFTLVMAYKLDQVTLKKLFFSIISILLLIVLMEVILAVNTKRKQGCGLKKQLKSFLFSKSGMIIIFSFIAFCVVFRLFFMHSAFIGFCDLKYFPERRILQEFSYSGIDENIRFRECASDLIFMQKKYGKFWIDYKIYQAKSDDFSSLFYKDDDGRTVMVLGNKKHNERYIDSGAIEEFGFLDMTKYCFEYLHKPTNNGEYTWQKLTKGEFFVSGNTR